MRKLLFLLLFGSLVLFYFSLPTSCSKEPPLPEFNPFDTLSYPETAVPPVEVDSNSFLGLHHHIFSKSCNVPGCHDGSFEPDFRTVESAYNSLVRHGIAKNYVSNPLEYRVMPGNKEESMLWKRITEHNPPNFEIMPSSGNPLAQDVVDRIGNWIDNGAKDIFGVDPVQTSLQPSPFGMLCFLPNQGGARIDDQRGSSPYQPFMAPVNDDLELWFGYLEEQPAGDTVFGNVLTVNELKFSTNPYNFSNAVTVNMQVPFIPQTSTYAFSTINIGFPLPYTQTATVNMNSLGFQAGDIVYCRTYVKDSDHPFPTEIPKEDAPAPLILYFSMILQ